LKPVIAIVGRPNVGKSTLFNQITRSRDALVADMPGVTRDRLYGEGRIGLRSYIVIDTGGLSGEAEQLDGLMARQVEQAVQEADAVLFMVDARSGLIPGDQRICDWLRRLGKPVRLVVNKVDGIDPAAALAEFHGLGLGEPYPIAAAHGRGVAGLVGEVLAGFPESAEEGIPAEEEGGIRIAIAGRPNVGKSTLVNRMLGEERVVVCDLPGTTRDSIFIPLERRGRRYTLIDTAGVRRRGRVREVVEKFSVVKTLQAIEAAHVVIHVVDAREGVSDQDLRLLGFVIETGKALVIAVNKWDGMDRDERERVRNDLRRRLAFADFARIHFISALHGTGVGDLYASVEAAYEAATQALSTTRLTQVLTDAVADHAPPLVHGRRIKLRYAHLGGRNPPLIIIHGNQTEHVPDSYRRYLANTFRKVFKLEGTPVRIEFKTGENPFAGRKNPLTPRQQEKRKRLMRHTKKKGR